MQAEALRQGIPQGWLDAARKSPVYQHGLRMEDRLPAASEYRTLPMVWYVPPLSPIQSRRRKAASWRMNGMIPDVQSLRIPLKYLANLLTAGDGAPVLTALQRMLAMRAFKRSEVVDGEADLAVLRQVGLTPAQVEDMYRLLAIANYEDRFVIPSSHKELVEDSFNEKRQAAASRSATAVRAARPRVRCSARSPRAAWSSRTCPSRARSRPKPADRTWSHHDLVPRAQRLAGLPRSAAAGGHARDRTGARRLARRPRGARPRRPARYATAC